MNSIIEVKDVTFTYSGAQRCALEHASLAVAEGEFVGIIGPSGAGKSTLAAVMSGAVPHHFAGELYGACLVDGRDTCEVALTDVSRLVGSVLQDIDAQFVASNVRDELLFGLENFGVPYDEIPARMQQALETVDIEELRDREIATLSGGQKQKVAIAAILALRPRVLVLDEPTAALDPASSTLVFETLREVNRSAGITVVVIEQKVALLSQYCSRVVVLDQGKLILDGTPREVFAHGEQLRSIGVDSPRVARVSNSLAAEGLCEAGNPALSVDEAAALVARVVGAGMRGADAEGVRAASGASNVLSNAMICDSLIDSDPFVVAPSPAHAGEPMVRFEGVGYSYPGGGASVRALDFEAFPGEIVGIVGQNGAGKTTLTKLLLRLSDIQDGRILIDGQNIAECTQQSLRRSIAYVPQEALLFHRTIAENIAYGRPDATMEQIRQAAAQANALDFIENLPEGFDTITGERGVKLSGGQRQRVAIARALLADCPVLVLDEATSALDSESEALVQDALSTLMRGRTCIVVAHRLSTVASLDRIVVLDKGKVVEDGPHADLVAANGEYANLWNRQTGAYLK